MHSLPDTLAELSAPFPQFPLHCAQQRPLGHDSNCVLSSVFNHGSSSLPVRKDFFTKSHLGYPGEGFGGTRSQPVPGRGLQGSWALWGGGG